MTDDAFRGGRVRLLQPDDGYRVNADSLLLADFCAPPALPAGSAPARSVRPARLVVDLGAGVGALAIFLLDGGVAERALLVERDAEQAARARANLARNGLADRAEVLVGDVADLEALPRGGADLVVCNPPYTEPGRGRIAKGGRAGARAGRLDAFTRAARHVLGARGAACFVYPARDCPRLFAELGEAGLHPKRARFVHSTLERPARVVLVRAQPGRPGGLEIAPPLVTHEPAAGVGVPDRPPAAARRGPDQ